MDRIFLCMVCSGVTLLITALALATPGIRASAHAQFEQAPLVHLLHAKPVSRHAR